LKAATRRTVVVVDNAAFKNKLQVGSD